MKKVAIILLSIGGLVVLALTANWYFSTYRPLQKRLSEVASLLIDPSSAQFRNVREGNAALCGEINGKNSWGAYAGFTPFYWTWLGAMIAPTNGDATDIEVFNVVYMPACLGKEYKPPANPFPELEAPSSVD